MKITQVRDFLQGYKNYFTKEDLPAYITEQVELRAFLCSSCLSAGKCKHCGCKTPAMFYAPKKVDSERKWAEFLTEDQWNTLKENITAYAEYFNQQDVITKTENRLSGSTDVDKDITDESNASA